MTGNLYICFASRYAEPSIAPVLWNTNRFDQILIVVGQSNPPTSEDVSHALEPADRYEWLLKRRCNATIETVVVPTYEARDVSRRLNHWLGRAPRVKDIVVNVTGGTVPMNFGVVRAVQDWAEHDSERSYQVSYFTPRPSPLLRVIEMNGRSPDLAHNPEQGGSLTLEDFVGLRGLRLLGEEQISTRLRARRALVEDMWASAGPNASWRVGFNAADLGIAIATLAGFFGKKSKAFWRQRDASGQPCRLPIDSLINTLKRKVPKKQQIDHDALSEVLANWAGRMVDQTGLSLGVDKSHVELRKLQQTLDFLGGAWFEELVYWKAIEVVERLGIDAEVKLNLLLQVVENAALMGFAEEQRSKRDKTFELDLALFRNGQLNALECKSGVFGGRGEGSGINQQVMDKLIAVKDLVLGKGGRLTLITFRSFPKQQSYPNMLKIILQRESIRMGCGFELDRAIEDFVRSA